MHKLRLVYFVPIALLAMARLQTAEFDLAATSTNQLAVDLHRQLATGNENLCLSPYSIQGALAMAFAGAAGETRTEMARVLHFPDQGNAIDTSFNSLQHSLEQMSAKTAEMAKESKRFGGQSKPIKITIANRLIAQSDHKLRES